MSALWRTAGRSKGGIAAERDGFFAQSDCKRLEKNIFSCCAKSGKSYKLLPPAARFPGAGLGKSRRFF